VQGLRQGRVEGDEVEGLRVALRQDKHLLKASF
jgi:hypothetical protein